MTLWHVGGTAAVLALLVAGAIDVHPLPAPSSSEPPAVVASPVLLPGGAAEDTSVRGTRLAPPDADTVRALVHALQQPLPEGPVVSGSIGASYEEECVEMFWRQPRRDWKTLARAGPRVVPVLETIARTHRRWSARCQAAYVLALRGHRGMASVVAPLLQSDFAPERVIGWACCSTTVWQGHGRPPIAAADAMAMHAREKDDDVRDEIEYYLGATGSQAAVGYLVGRLQRGLGDYAAAWSLGALGNASAVPALITLADRREARYACFHALAKIGTPDAVAYLLAHLDHYAAVSAVAKHGFQVAIPHLERRLREVESNPSLATSFRESSDLRVALIALRHDDPCGPYLDVIADRSQDLDLRRRAASRLSDVAPARQARHLPRMVSVYRATTDHWIREHFFHALKDRRGEGIDEALLHHASTWTWPHTEKGGDLESLLEVLSERLGTDFLDLEDVRAYRR